MNTARRILSASAACAAAIGWVLGGHSAQAAVTFFNNDAVGFTAGVAGYVPLGVETFEQNTSVGQIVQLNDPLSQGVANGPFPVGLVLPMALQSNLNGGNPLSPNPRGGNGLALVDAGQIGATTDRVVSNFQDDSLDIILNPADQIVGVGFNPVTHGNSGPVEVRVFGTSNNLLGATTIAGNQAGSNFLGLVTTGGDLIARVNLSATVFANEGADNIALFAVPEPTSLVLLAIGALVCSGRRRHR